MTDENHELSFREFVDKTKTWKAKKADVLKFWQGLKPSLPLQMEPVPEHHRGTRFRNDGMRITGSPQFINSIMSRIKDLLQFEGGQYRLDVEYRQIEAPTASQMNSDYVFYVHLIKKGESGGGFGT